MLGQSVTDTRIEYGTLTHRIPLVETAVNTARGSLATPHHSVARLWGSYGIAAPELNLPWIRNSFILNVHKVYPALASCKVWFC